MTTHSHSARMASRAIAPARTPQPPAPLAGAEFSPENFRKGHIFKLWRFGKNTQEIAQLLGSKEHEVYSLLSKYREAARLEAVNA